MNALKLTIAIVALTFTSAICQAQPGGGHPGKHERGAKHRTGEHPGKNNKGEKLVKELELTTKQADQLKTINEKQRADNKAIQEKMAPHKAELKKLKEKKKALNEIRMKEIESLLTPNQLIKFNELKGKRKSKKQTKKRLQIGSSFNCSLNFTNFYKLS